MCAMSVCSNTAVSSAHHNKIQRIVVEEEQENTIKGVTVTRPAKNHVVIKFSASPLRSRMDGSKSSG